MKIHLTALLLLVASPYHLCDTGSLPNPPQIEKLICNQRDAVLSWIQEDNDTNAPILYYIIEYAISFSPEIWEIAQDQIPSSETFFAIAMSPWANYTFRIKAVNKIGYSFPSQQSEICTTQPDVPYKDPDNVKGEGSQPNNLVISWNVMPPIEHNGPNFHYRVYWKKDTIGSAYEAMDIFDWQQNQIVINDTPSFTKYRIKVTAFNKLGESNILRKEIIGYSGEDIPQLAPEKLNIDEILSPTTAILSWESVPLSSIQGHFKGYKIKTWTDSTNNFKEMIVSKDTTRALITFFTPYTKNFVQVYVYNRKYNGPPSNTISFDAPEGIPGPISALEAYPLGSSNFYLTWRKPEKPNGILKGYKINLSLYHGTMLETIKVEPKITDPNQLQTKVSGLYPNTKYRIYVSAFTDAGESQKFYIERKTGNAAPTKPSVPDFTWKRLPGNDADVRIAWLPNFNENPGDHFFVKYREKGEAPYINTVPEFSSDYLDIRGLKPDQIYEFVVVAVDGEYETPSEPEEISIASGTVQQLT